MMAGLPASYFCVKTFSEMGQTEDLKQINLLTPILHGDDDQVVQKVWAMGECAGRCLLGVERPARERQEVMTAANTSPGGRRS